MAAGFFVDKSGRLHDKRGRFASSARVGDKTQVIHAEKVFGLAGVLSTAAAKVPVKAQKAALRAALLLETRIKANASGRPGPRAITGDYRRSWRVTNPRFVGGVLSVQVGTNKPQARRLEYGFVGTDSIGRVYNQPPFPHVAPAVAATQVEFRAAVRAAGRDLA
jgi:hypothetical protein